jgi:hypothetical protein
VELQTNESKETQGLKPNIIFAELAARLKSCPDASRFFIEFLRNW